jgi:predicted lipoprotein with Yx(FWY)xxD motif
MKTHFLNSLKGLAFGLVAVMLLAACQPKISSAPPVATEAPTIAPSGTQASGSVAINVSSNAALGNFLVDQNGMTLYIFKMDTAGVSNCTGSCAQNWPALTVASASALPTAGAGVAGTLGTITRSDGTFQVTYNGMPLYYFAGDKAPGDTNGQGIGGNWFVATPTASSAPMISATPLPTLPSYSGSGSGGGYSY